MDCSTCLKSLLLELQQHRDQRTERSSKQLIRKMEALSALPLSLLLSSLHPLFSQSLTELLQLAGDPNTSHALTSSILTLLSQLAADEQNREILQNNFDLNTTLSCTVLHTHTQSVLLQSLQLLQDLSYNSRTFHSINQRELLAFLIKTIQQGSEGLLVPCLSLLANLCRWNRAIQNAVKREDQVNSFYRSLIRSLDHSSQDVVVYSLSILASLTLDQRVGEKLFGPSNLHQTFQLIFNIIVNGDRTRTRRTSVDLLLDLLDHPTTLNTLSRYQHLGACLQKVLELLSSKDLDSAAKLLQLLLAVSRVSSLRPVLLQLIHSSARPAGEAGPESLLQFLSGPIGEENCRRMTVELLKELLQEALSPGSPSPPPSSFLASLLPVLLELLRSFSPQQEVKQLRTSCQLVSKVNDLLLLLCTEDSARSLLSNHVSAQLLVDQVEALLTCYHGNGPLTCRPLGYDRELREECCEAVMKTLELMKALRQEVKDMEPHFYSLLQDPRLVSPLSLSLSSSLTGRVQSGLSLLAEATPLKCFPSELLGESMAANNSFCHVDSSLVVSRPAGQEVPPPSLQAPPPDRLAPPPTDPSILQNAVKREVKDSPLSEVLEVYDQKLSALATQENLLQNLLQSRSVALNQAERLLQQYRVQREEAESQASRLAAALREAEFGREAVQAELNVQLGEMERSKVDFEELLRHNKRLQEDSVQHQTLKRGYNTLLERLQESEDQLEKQRLGQSELKKKLEEVHLLQEKREEVLRRRDEEVKTLSSELQKRKNEITGLRAELEEEERRMKVEEEDKKELEETVDVLRKELQRMEEGRKEAVARVSSLEQVKSNLESQLKVKEAELVKHATRIARIHSLTSRSERDSSA